MVLKPLAMYARERHLDYAKALAQAIKGALPSRRLAGRWYIEVEDNVQVSEPLALVTPEPSA